MTATTFDALQTTLSTGSGIVVTAVLTAAGVFIGVALVGYAIRKIRGQVK